MTGARHYFDDKRHNCSLITDDHPTDRYVIVETATKGDLARSEQARPRSDQRTMMALVSQRKGYKMLK